MKKYLSFGGGVNSVAMILMLLDQKDDFEAIFVDHGTDYPETYEYFNMFQNWLKTRGHKQITVLKPAIEIKKDGITFDNLYDYSFHYKMVPTFMFRWCTDKFKIRVVNKYVEKPCFMYLGIDFGEIKRAKISYNKNIENRFPLIENEINRIECKEIIKKHGLTVPIKSGCYICPYQSTRQWEILRISHPDLFCKAEKLEKQNMEYRTSIGKKPLTLSAKGVTLRKLIEEDQYRLFEEDKLPPCQCGL